MFPNAPSSLSLLKNMVNLQGFMGQSHFVNWSLIVITPWPFSLCSGCNGFLAFSKYRNQMSVFQLLTEHKLYVVLLITVLLLFPVTGWTWPRIPRQIQKTPIGNPGVCAGGHEGQSEGRQRPGIHPFFGTWRREAADPEALAKRRAGRSSRERIWYPPLTPPTRPPAQTAACGCGKSPPRCPSETVPLWVATRQPPTRKTSVDVCVHKSGRLAGLVLHVSRPFVVSAAKLQHAQNAVADQGPFPKSMARWHFSSCVWKTHWSCLWGRAFCFQVNVHWLSPPLPCVKPQSQVSQTDCHPSGLRLLLCNCLLKLVPS